MFSNEGEPVGKFDTTLPERTDKEAVEGSSSWVVQKEKCIAVFIIGNFFLFSSTWDGLFAEEFQEIEADVKKYLGTLRRSMKESHLKVFMEQLSSNSQSFFSFNNTRFWFLLLYPDDLLKAMDHETMRTLAMQRVQQLILNPESRSLTVFPLPGMTSSGCSTQSTVIPQPWLQASSASDSGNTICANYSRMDQQLSSLPSYRFNRQ